MRADFVRWTWRVVAALAVVGALTYVPRKLYGSAGYVTYRALGRQHAVLAAGNEALRGENDALRRQVVHLRDDLSAVAKIARDELGMVGAGELVFQIDRPGAATASP